MRTHQGIVIEAFGARELLLESRGELEAHGALPVPKKLRNAPTALMKKEGFGEGYRYAHAEEGGRPAEACGEEDVFLAPRGGLHLVKIPDGRSDLFLEPAGFNFRVKADRRV
mgnify:CR=1 FL=1